jgi:DNA-binding response OmpR family regulator
MVIRRENTAALRKQSAATRKKPLVNGKVERRPYTAFIIDQKSGTSSIGKILTRMGIHSRGFSSGEVALRTALASPPSIVIMEAVLAKENGLSLCQRIRQSSSLSLIPVIFVSVLRDEADKVAGLSAGADDYIAKPFGEREFAARVTAHLRRCYELVQPAKLRFGRVELDPDTVTLTVRKRHVEISLSEFRLLEYFVKNPGRTFHRDHLLQMIRTSSREVNHRVVDVYVKRIRSKIEINEARPQYLRTVRGLGYCFHYPEKAGQRS